MQIKRELRILGIDDGHFSKQDKEVIVIGTIFRGGKWMDGVLSTFVQIDGSDSTEKLIHLVKKSKHFGQLRCIMINGIALGGFNVLDIKALNKKTSLPVIVTIRKIPNLKKIKSALEKAKQPEKMSLIKKAGKIYSTNIGNKKVYFQIAGISSKEAAKIIYLSATRSLIPEPLRSAHLIASGITLGESKKRV